MLTALIFACFVLTGHSFYCLPHSLFIFFWQVTVFMSRTFTRRQGLIAGCVVASVHLLFLLYLHFAYHSVYEGLSHFHLCNNPE